jgi:hypothetical protein
MSKIVNLGDEELAKFLEQLSEILSKKQGRPVPKAEILRDALIMYIKNLGVEMKKCPF